MCVYRTMNKENVKYGFLFFFLRVPLRMNGHHICLSFVVSRGVFLFVSWAPPATRPSDEAAPRSWGCVTWFSCPRTLAFF